MLRVKVLIIGPSLSAKGGVALYYRNMLPLLKVVDDVKLSYLEIGSSGGKRPMQDIASVFSAIKNQKPDVVHVNTSLNWKGFLRDGIYLGIAKIFRSKRLVFFRGWSMTDRETNSLFFRIYFRFFYWGSSGYCVLADKVGEKIKSMDSNGKVFPVTTSVDESLLSGFDERAWLNKINVENSELNILFLSRVEVEKGVFELLEAVRLLLVRKIKVKLVVAGEGGALDNLKRKAIESGLGESVQFIGFVEGDQKAKRLFQSDLFCLPSYTEGMPNAVLEAMCFGLPVIACPVGALADLITDESGILVPAGSAGELAMAIEKYYLDREGMREVAVNNRTVGLERFLSSHAAENLLSIYREVA